jgi:hypothetical protein
MDPQGAGGGQLSGAAEDSEKGLEACPDSREIEWELLFIGEPEKKRGAGIDFSVIKSWILEIYRRPGELSEEKRRKMRSGFFEDPNLVRVLGRFEDPEAKQQEYLQRLCTEYVELFLAGNNQVMGRIFGLQLGRDPEKRLAVPVAEMIGRIRQDEELLPEQREQLWKALYRAYGIRTNGNTEILDEMIN